MIVLSVMKPIVRTAGIVRLMLDSAVPSERLIERWHGDRLRYAYAPRFVPSCTDELLREVGVQARARRVRIHTHASENLGELALVRARFGKDNISVLDDFGLARIELLRTMRWRRFRTQPSSRMRPRRLPWRTRGDHWIFRL